MTQGRSIRLLLVDGTPNGLLTAEIMNWTGHVLTGPRSKLSEVVQRLGSRAQSTESEAVGAAEPGYQSLYNQLCEDVVLVEGSDGTRVFNEDQSFSSPNAAAAVVSGRSANGRTSWKAEGTGLTYGEWQDRQVSAASLEEEASTFNEAG